MRVLDLILYIIGAVCFAAAAFGVAPAKVNLIALGLLSWIFVPLIATADTLH